MVDACWGNKMADGDGAHTARVSVRDRPDQPHEARSARTTRLDSCKHCYSDSDSDDPASEHHRLDGAADRCHSLITSVHAVLTHLLEFKELLMKECSANCSSINGVGNSHSKEDITIYITTVFREILPLKTLYQMMLDRITALKSERGTFSIPDLFLNKEIRATMNVYKTFLQQYSINFDWMSSFIRSNPICHDLFRQSCPSNVKGTVAPSIEDSFYAVFCSLFSLELIVNSYIKCLDETDESYPKAIEVQSSLSALLNAANSDFDQGEFLTTHKELSLLTGVTREPKATTKFIFKTEVLKLSRKDDKPLPRLLILFSDCLYVTSRPGNISDKYSVRNEISLDTITICRVSEDENRNGSLKWGLNISAREICQDFYFKNEQVMNAWVTKLQDAVGNRNIKFDEKIQTDYRPKIGEEAPRWQKDNASKYCNGYKCNKTFSLTVRKRRCYADGLLYCDACCSMKIKLKFDRSSESRVCELCYRILLEDSSLKHEVEEAKKALENVFKKKTRKGKMLDWLTEQVYNREKATFGPAVKYFCELDLTDPIIKLYERQEDKCTHHEIMLLGMTVQTGKESKHCKSVRPNQFVIEHKYSDDAHLFDAQTFENCELWVKCLNENICDYCNK